MDWATYKAAIIPIALLFSLVLWLGNAAYEYLSVSFIQMLKAQMSVWVYGVAVAFKLEKFLPKASTKRVFSPSLDAPLNGGNGGREIGALRGLKGDFDPQHASQEPRSAPLSISLALIIIIPVITFIIILVI